MKAIYVSARQPDSPGGQLARRPVGEVMSRPVLAVDAGVRLVDALQTMVRSGRRHLVVVDGAGRCLGVLADRVIASAWAQDPAGLSRRAVAGVLDTARPATVSESARVVDAARLMRAAGVDAVAVVDAAGSPVGIVTGSDLIGLLAS